MAFWFYLFLHPPPPLLYLSYASTNPLRSLIVLDEPTNYLDRDSLGALSKALKEFEGGVVIISHNAEFTESLTSEVWSVVDGLMTPSGHNWVQGQGAGPRLANKEDDDEETFGTGQFPCFDDYLLIPYRCHGQQGRENQEEGQIECKRSPQEKESQNGREK